MTTRAEKFRERIRKETAIPTSIVRHIFDDVEARGGDTFALTLVFLYSSIEVINDAVGREECEAFVAMAMRDVFEDDASQ